MNRTTIHLPWFLRAPRAGGLWLVGILIPIATLAGFILSYRGLYDWATGHGWPYYLAPLFPLLIDLLIISGEVVLFVAAIDGDTSLRVRASAWAMTVGFTALSVAGNVSHAATADVPTRVGWALPPVVLALALGFGLGILKRQAAKYRPGVHGQEDRRTVPSDVFEAAKVSYAATLAAGNPWSHNRLREQFGLTRAQATEVVASFGAPETNGNGHGPE